MRFKTVLFLLPLSLYAQPGFYEPWGKDADLHYISINDMSQDVSKDMSYSPLIQVAEKIIHFHQKVLSPADGPRSHFVPSSSQYMLLAIYKYGFFKGFALGCDRLLRENDAEWVYRKTTANGKLYKYNPVP